MSELLEIPVELRETQGKGASRRLRHQGLVPGIVYGGHRPPQAIQLPQFFLAKALENEAFYTSVMQLTAGGKAQKVVLRDLQRHPVKPMVMHIDFQRVMDDEVVRMTVPLHFMNEATSPAGKKSGVVISHQLNEVEISCLPGDLPEYVEVDLAAMDVGDTVTLRQIQLPAGVTLTAHDDAGLDQPVVSAVAVRGAAGASDGEGGDEAPAADG